MTEKYTTVLLAATKVLMDVNAECPEHGNWIIEGKIPPQGLDLGQIRDLVDTVHGNATTMLISPSMDVRIIGQN